MTDEQRPWREWPEWTALDAAIMAYRHRGRTAEWRELDQARHALCARAWREGAHAILTDANRDWEAERTRADTAEAQRDRLQREVDQLSDGFWREHRPATSDEHGIDGRIHGYCRRCIKPWPCEYSPEARAALADVPERKPWSETQLEDAALGIRTPDDRARRRDEAYRAMVEAGQQTIDGIASEHPQCDITNTARCYCGRVTASLRRALALARQVEEG